MNRTEWIAATAAQTGLTKKQTEKILLTALRIIGDTLAEGESVRLTGFGQFETRYRAARVCRGFQKDAPAQRVAAAVLPVFRAGTQLRERVNQEKEQT